MKQTWLTRIGVGLLVCATSALAQYTGGTTPGMGTGSGSTPVYTAPSGGYKSSTGIAIGSAAAAGVVVGYLVMHNRGTVTGCVESRSDGQMELLGKGADSSYILLNSGVVSLQPGERVRLKGKKEKDAAGLRMFEVHSLSKTYGACKG